ncbi:MAG: hypothetical protein QUT30_06570 [Acidobacteriota bacterium]|nr:hypothetical protein [Acidobacteriota bacterium]
MSYSLPTKNRTMGVSFMSRFRFGVAGCILSALFMVSCSTQSNNASSDAGKKAIALGDLPVERCLFYIEGEDFEDKSGGALDYKEAAYGKKCLGMRWGEKQTDFAEYILNLENPIESALLVVRVAIEDSKPLRYDILLNDRVVQSTDWGPTGGYGYTEKEWKCYSIPMGRMEKGKSSLKIRPSRQGGIVNIDCLAVGSAN